MNPNAAPAPDPTRFERLRAVPATWVHDARVAYHGLRAGMADRRAQRSERQIAYEGQQAELASTIGYVANEHILNKEVLPGLQGEQRLQVQHPSFSHPLAKSAAAQEKLMWSNAHPSAQPPKKPSWEATWRQHIAPATTRRGRRLQQRAVRLIRNANDALRTQEQSRKVFGDSRMNHTTGLLHRPLLRRDDNRRLRDGTIDAIEYNNRRRHARLIAFEHRRDRHGDGRHMPHRGTEYPTMAYRADFIDHQKAGIAGLVNHEIRDSLRRTARAQRAQARADVRRTKHEAKQADAARAAQKARDIRNA